MQRVVPYMFCIGLIGIFTLVLLRKRFIIDYRLQFPSGTATGVLISSFHTPKGETAAREQVRPLIFCSYALCSLLRTRPGARAGPAKLVQHQVCCREELSMVQML